MLSFNFASISTLLMSGSVFFATTLRADSLSKDAIVVGNSGLHVAVSDFEGIPFKLESFRSEEFDVGGGSLRKIDQILELPRMPFTLIYGGDVGDRGKATRANFRFWIAAKDAHPDQVVLLAGNRDLNKLRLLVSTAGLEGDSLVEKVKFIFSNKLPETKMGAYGAFEFRREELSEEQGGATIGDLEVAQSFADEVKPGGLVWEYLIRAQLGYYTHEKKTVIAHGAVPWNQKVVIPSVEGGAEKLSYDDFYQGINSLNRWYREALLTESGRRALNEYCRPPAGAVNNPESLVYNRMQNRSGIFSAPRLDATLSPFKRAVVFHTPQGEVGAGFINDASEEVWVLDNSGSFELPPPVAFVDDAKNSYWTGVLSSGQRVRFDSPFAGSAEDPYLGNYVTILNVDEKPRNYLVTARVEKTGEYVLTRSDNNYQIETILRRPRALAAAVRSACESRSSVRADPSELAESSGGHMRF